MPIYSNFLPARSPPPQRTMATRRSAAVTSTPMMAAMRVVCSPEQTGQAFTGALPATMAVAQALQPAKPQPPQLAPGRVAAISVIRGSVWTSKTLEAMASSRPKQPPRMPSRATADSVLIMFYPSFTARPGGRRSP